MIEQDESDIEAKKASLQVEYWPLDRLIPYTRNARTHSAAQVAEIAGSIRAFGFSNPILIGEGGDVIAGHGRLAAARKLELTTVPVVTTGNTSPAGTRYARKAIGPATASRRRCGPSAAAARTLKPSMRPKSRSSACAGPC